MSIHEKSVQVKRQARKNICPTRGEATPLYRPPIPSHLYKCEIFVEKHKSLLFGSFYANQKVL
jgi:hypothetical protein